MLQRLAALLLLFVTFGSNAESVVGLVRDGEVHHESSAAAAQHATTGAGEHGHEDGAPAGSHRHGRGHEHGTTGDHCTHAHGVALLPILALALPGSESAVRHLEPILRAARASQPFDHPPKA